VKVAPIVILAIGITTAHEPVFNLLGVDPVADVLEQSDYVDGRAWDADRAFRKPGEHTLMTSAAMDSAGMVLFPKGEFFDLR
jgi:hypothetical protein